MAQGLLDKSGWYLLDDTQTAVWTSDGWIAAAPGRRPAGRLPVRVRRELRHRPAATWPQLTGPAPLLPEYAFGNWFSRYYAYTAAEYENELLPEFKANGVPLDTLSVDTDWKSPNQWDGWEWNPALFPTPRRSWPGPSRRASTSRSTSTPASRPAIPQYAQAQAIAGGTLALGQLLQRPVRGVGLEPDPAGRVELRAAAADPERRRRLLVAGLVLRRQQRVHARRHPGQLDQPPVRAAAGQHRPARFRAGPDRRVATRTSNAGAYPAGPWADHRSAIAFTGDTWSTWNTLAMRGPAGRRRGQHRRALRQQRHRRVPRPAVRRRRTTQTTCTCAGCSSARSSRSCASTPTRARTPRLPWEYDAATQAIGDQFMQLRESLVPYLYTLAQQASTSGLPMTQALYLDYPSQPPAYDHPGEYLLGPDMLVAPVTTPGTVATTKVWFPPGQWTDWFTGATFTGPSTQTLEVPLGRMPVFVQAGGIVPLQPSSGPRGNGRVRPADLRVFAGANGGYTMYDDAGQGLGYTRGQYRRHADQLQLRNRGQLDRHHRAGPRLLPWRPGQPPVHAGPGRPEQPAFGAGRRAHRCPPPAGATTAPPTPCRCRCRRSGRRAPPRSRRSAGRRCRSAEPAATQLTIKPPGSVVTTAGASTTVSTTLANSGPGRPQRLSLGLNAPPGWTVTPTTPTTAPSLAAGSSLTASWSVTAPASRPGDPDGHAVGHARRTPTTATGRR